VGCQTGPKFLLQARNEILLKTMVQVIPTYNMSIFQLPFGLCKEINVLMQKFWWRHEKNEAKICCANYNTRKCTNRFAILYFASARSIPQRIVLQKLISIQTNPILI
jgi:hypothetical protein